MEGILIVTEPSLATAAVAVWQSAMMTPSLVAVAAAASAARRRFALGVSATATVVVGDFTSSPSCSVMLRSSLPLVLCHTCAVAWPLLVDRFPPAAAAAAGGVTLPLGAMVSKFRLAERLRSLLKEDGEGAAEEEEEEVVAPDRLDAVDGGVGAREEGMG